MSTLKLVLYTMIMMGLLFPGAFFYWEMRKAEAKYDFLLECVQKELDLGETGDIYRCQ